jgi:hypothetical protein
MPGLRDLSRYNAVYPASLMAKLWNDLTFDDMQSVFQKWMSRFGAVIENRRGYIHE